jgi:hypothetical protein
LSERLITEIVQTRVLLDLSFPYKVAYDLIILIYSVILIFNEWRARINKIMYNDKVKN